MKATECDDCGAEIPYGVTCWMIRRGMTIDEVTGREVPLVKVVCAACHD